MIVAFKLYVTHILDEIDTKIKVNISNNDKNGQTQHSRFDRPGSTESVNEVLGAYGQLTDFERSKG